MSGETVQQKESTVKIRQELAERERVWQAANADYERVPGVDPEVCPVCKGFWPCYHHSLGSDYYPRQILIALRELIGLLKEAKD